MPWSRTSAPGHLAFQEPGVITLRSTRGDGMLTGPEAARLAGISPSTLRTWRQRKHISPDGLDERGRPLYYPSTVRAAERTVTQNGLRTRRINPRAERRSIPSAARQAA